jgi:DNA transformation protein and related proteins
MAVTKSYLTFVTEQLERIPSLVTKRMFGGIGVYSGETFFAVIDNDTLFFKVDEALAARYRDRGMPPFAPIPGQRPMTGYYQVPPDVLEDADALARWAGDSLRISASARPRKKASSRARGR